jgi:hypothetical protein
VEIRRGVGSNQIMRALCSSVVIVLSLAGPAAAHSVEVSISASVAGAQAYIDGDETAVPLPAFVEREPGTMRLRVVAPGYRPYHAAIEILEGSPVSHHAELMRSSAAELAAVDRRRSYGMAQSAMFWGGMSLIGVGVLFLALPAPDSPAQDALYRRFAFARNRAEADRLYDELRRMAATAQALQLAGVITLAVGGAAALTWGLLFLLAPAQKSTTALSAQVGVGPGGLSVFGSF